MLAVRRRVRRQVARHDRAAVRLAVHFAVWTRDRDARASAAAAELAGHGQPAAVADVYRLALRDYREEACRVRREHRELHVAEARLHARLRRRRGTPMLELVLPDDCLALLDAWRQRAETGEPGRSLDRRLPRPAAYRRAA